MFTLNHARMCESIKNVMKLENRFVAINFDIKLMVEITGHFSIATFECRGFLCGEAF